YTSRYSGSFGCRMDTQYFIPNRFERAWGDRQRRDGCRCGTDCRTVHDAFETGLIGFFYYCRKFPIIPIILKVSSAYQAYPDSALVSLIKIGDHEAFTEIYNRYGGLMYRHAYAVLKDTDACNDLVQDVFLTLWNKREAVQIATVSNY